MADSDRLFSLDVNPADIPAGLDLVVALTGYSDAGSASAQFIDFVRENLDSRVVATFDNDELLDYRARRPIATFDEDHLSDYVPPRLELTLVHDELSQPFLFLSGYEPDFRWEAFVRSITGLIDTLGIARTTWLHAVPMPVPHTRPVPVTVSGTRADLIESLTVWRPQTQLPANVLHLLEYRLTEHGLAVAGLALLTPHYLSDTQYPDVLIAAIEYVGAATGLILPTDGLRDQAREFVERLNEQVAGNDELRRLVATLEERHDSYMESNMPASPFVAMDGSLPSADEIAAELERFLAGRPEGEDNGEDLREPGE